MRLTLRTLLAFLDDTLDRKDAQELGEKVEESDTARKLVARIRDVVHRLRLGAPAVEDRAQGLDPNTVAEYLDSELPKDRVPDFEKVCLDSDVQLAEVASCHQILTMVLGEPADIDPKSREQMYDVPKRLSAEAVAAEVLSAPLPPGSATPGEDDSSHVLRHKPEVPDYLREPAPKSNRILPAAAAVLLISLLVVMLLGAGGLFEPGGWLHDRLIGSKTEELAETSEPKQTTTSVAKKDDGQTAAAPAPGAAAKTEPSKAATSESSVPAKPGAPPSTTPPTAPVPADVAPVPAAKSPVGPAVAAGSEKTPSPPPGESTADPASKPATEGSQVAMNTAGKVPPPSATAKASADKAEPGAEPAPMPPERIGRLVSAKQLLLQYDSAAGEWKRVPLQAAMNSGTAILSLPSYQPVISLSVPITVQLIGGAQVEFLPTDPQGTAGIKVQFGRLVLRAVGDAKPRLKVHLGSRSGIVTLQSADSTVAMSVYRSRQPGADPEQEPGSLKADFYAANGAFAWSDDPSRPPVALTAPAQLRVDDLPAAVPIAPAPIPAWVNADETSTLDQGAALAIEQSVSSNRPVLLSLRELVDHRRREVSSLAVRCLAYIGSYEPLADVLNSPDYRSAWDEQIVQLQSAISRGPETAAKVRQGFEARYAADGAILYRLLWGYSDADIRSGAGNLLADYLDHELLAVRVLAFHNLKKIMVARYTYSPTDAAAKRQAAIARWKKEIAAAALAPARGASEPKKTPLAPATPTVPEAKSGPAPKPL